MYRSYRTLAAGFLLMAAISCVNKNNMETGSQAVHRYEQALFGLDTNRMYEGLKKIAPEFSLFLGDRYHSPEAQQQLKQFITDAGNREAFNKVVEVYPDLNALGGQLEKLRENYRREFPGKQPPEFYTYVSGYDYQMPVKFNDTSVVIALDMFLGPDHPRYAELGIPTYISQRFTPQHILPAVVKELGYPLVPAKADAYTLLDAMIEQGKILYLMDVLAPEVPEWIKLGYIPEQLAWVKQHESNLWQFMIENELLFSSDSKALSMFMVDGPFTSSLGQESPARTGDWIGWQIVRMYAQKIKPSLTDLLNKLDSQEILERSGFKPRK